MRASLLIKIAIGLVLIAVLGLLFVRSAISTRSEPYTTRAAWLREWKVVVESPIGPNEALLSLEAPREFASDLFRQVFSRSGESLSGPSTAAIPLVLKGEFDRSLAGHVTAEGLAAAARTAGLESSTLVPQCLGYRRVSAPGVNRQLYFVLFDAPAIAQFREQVQKLRPAEGATAAAYDPRSLSPILIVAATDSAFSRWLPLVADASGDCLAPLVSN
jgi:hypothetical protein